MNEFYTYGDTLIPNTVARSSDVKAEYQGIEAGFDKLPTEAEMKLGTAQYGTDSGAANAYVVTMPYTPTGYTAGMVVRFKATNANTSSSTVNVDSLGTKSIKRPNGSALTAGDIETTGITTLVYNGTDFIITDGLPAVQTAAEAAQAAAEAAQAAAETAQGLAETAQGLAEDAEAAAEAAWDYFDDRYLGAKASDPTLDNDGNALVTGAIYWNTVSNKFLVWSGSAWADAIQGALSAAGGTMSGDLAMGDNDITGIKNVGFTAEYDNGDSGTSKTITFSNGQKQKVRLTAGTTLTLSFSGCPAGLYQLRLYNNGTGGYAVTWSGISSTNWIGQSSAPGINGDADASTIVNFWYDGSTPYGAVSRVGMA